ncbi:hypothetical protein BK816_00640 [Boudabousia tangfeifanii]|uniref:Pilus assembly protein TadE n=1 Tax=Boudabousia tangfeifanii TaxID=1912795 RepID=A0A1D9MIE9_9ACTO|nr:hypothetical protein [Boudabousia tangfeifanii]AOZ71983.1 hypothetical protein BK816_00640 [Boudabousia tangfeifanii]
MVTAETAVTAPIVVLALSLLFAGGRVSVDYLQACELARNAARQAAVSGTTEAGKVDLPNVSLQVTGSQVTVSVVKQSKMLGNWHLPAVTCQATIWQEQDSWQQTEP